MKTSQDHQPANVLCALPAPASAPARETRLILPRSFTARVNQMAHRKGKEHAEMWRESTLGALQLMANEGTPLDELSTALAAIEANKDGGLQRNSGPATSKCSR